LLKQEVERDEKSGILMHRLAEGDSRTKEAEGGEV
jgi:hypothetical protein